MKAGGMSWSQGNFSAALLEKMTCSQPLFAMIANFLAACCLPFIRFRRNFVPLLSLQPTIVGKIE